MRAEPGTLFHAVYPAPTFTLWTGIVALELIYKALAQGMPDRLPASSGGDVPGFMMVGTHPDTGEFFAISNNDAVGWGATPDHDGIDATIHISESIVRNTPMEVLEARSGMRFERLEILADSGGVGPVPRRVRAAPRHRVRLRRRVPVGDQEDQVAAVGAGRRSGAGGQPGDRVPRHRPRAARSAPNGSPSRPATGSAC